jgi:hypothetical protein
MGSMWLLKILASFRFSLSSMVWLVFVQTTEETIPTHGSGEFDEIAQS